MFQDTPQYMFNSDFVQCKLLVLFENNDSFNRVSWSWITNISYSFFNFDKTKNVTLNFTSKLVDVLGIFFVNQADKKLVGFLLPRMMFWS